MDVAVLGAGAMGCLYGGVLAEAGHKVTLIDIWKEHVQTLNAKGLAIEKDGAVRVINRNLRAVTNASEVGAAELVIVFVKATLTEKAMQDAKNLVGPQTVVLTLQNGLGNVEKLNRVVGSSHVIAGTSAHGSTMISPGHIKHAGSGKTIIGEQSGKKTERILTMSSIFNDSGLQTDVSDNVIGLIWTKLIVNVGINALTALTGLKNGQLLDYPETKRLMELAIDEACSVARAKGIRLEISDLKKHVAQIALATGGNRSSMLQDILNKRQTEIAVINGALVSDGHEVNVATPVNQVLSELIQVKQKTYDLLP